MSGGKEMKKKTAGILNIILAAALAFSLVGCDTGGGTKEPVALPDQKNWSIVSPDGTITADVSLHGDGSLSYNVRKGEVTVVEESALGFSVDVDDFRIVTLENAERKRITGSYENITGKHPVVEYDCNELTVTLKGYEFYLDVILRAYDDGYAFRYNIRAVDGSEGKMTVLGEESQITLPDNSVMWAEPYVPIRSDGTNFFSYESTYKRRSSTNCGGESISMPMLYQVSGTEIYSLVTESDLVGSGFYGSFLEEKPEDRNTGRFTVSKTPAGGPGQDEVEYPFTSPWRVGSVGDMKTVIESEMVEKVMDDVQYWRPDDYDSLSDEEKAIYDYDWVEPGVVAWNWLSYNGVRPQNDWALQREYVDLAQQMGWTYTLLDGGWDIGLTDEMLRSFMDYANERGVKVLIWCNALTDFANGDADILRAKLDDWKSFGIAGIKIDFFDGQNANNPSHYSEDINTIKWYETIYQETARRQMIVNCHGTNKPTGERRRYPNVINREAVYGNEFITVDSTITVNQMFVRGNVGPTDFTPVITPLAKGITVGHQMALAVLFESGTPSMADTPEEYLWDYLNDYYRAIPTLRDDTVFLCGFPDEYYCAAIRAGDEWFVAGINSLIESTVEIDFSFLGEGSYDAVVFTDGEDGIVRSSDTVDSSTVKQITMQADGGFVYYLKPHAEA